MSRPVHEELRVDDGIREWLQAAATPRQMINGIMHGSVSAEQLIKTARRPWSFRISKICDAPLNQEQALEHRHKWLTTG